MQKKLNVWEHTGILLNTFELSVGEKLKILGKKL